MCIRDRGNTVGIARTDRDDLPDIGRKGDIAPRLVALVAGALHENEPGTRRAVSYTHLRSEDVRKVSHLKRNRFLIIAEQILP